MNLKHFWSKLRREKEKTPDAKKWGLSIDLDKCSGCYACTQACRAENNTSYAGESEMDLGRGIFWMEIISIREGEKGEAGMKLQPTPCFQCDNTPCIKYCPTRATETNEEGITGQVYERCIGCRYCTVSCPYTRRYFNWYAPEMPSPLESLLNPDVSLRTKGVVEKCNFCYHRVLEAKWNAKLDNRQVKDGEITMACQQTCPSDAITFGDLQDSNSKTYKRARKKRAEVVMADLGTEPKVFYLKEEDVYVDN